jgi:2-phosphosulfolactate phosphatase
MVGSFLNLAVTAQWLAARPVERLTLVCAGTEESAAMEDVLCAGALCDLIANGLGAVELVDAAEVARGVYRVAADLSGVIKRARNGRRLLLNPELRDDVDFCLRRDVFNVVAGRGRDGRVEKWSA